MHCDLLSILAMLRLHYEIVHFPNSPYFTKEQAKELEVHVIVLRETLNLLKVSLSTTRICLFQRAVMKMNY